MRVTAAVEREAVRELGQEDPLRAGHSLVGADDAEGQAVHLFARRPDR